MYFIVVVAVVDLVKSDLADVWLQAFGSTINMIYTIDKFHIPHDVWKWITK